ncbi:alpha/beta hydrolase family protein [Qipengyuania soli]|uniref:S9 family peptidase n=1 Tax=Qipengyuania soli TaxID=2782568 RepID=A0A7S8F1C4_9SPHN|nr:S9 family peptidase [Qipengyuania soli]QPC97835.1 S9 family peptidase [Qipengyuania soli]
MHRIAKSAVSAIVMMFAATGASLQAQDLPTRAFTGNDLFKLEGAADPQISPDGSQIVYVRMTGDVMKDTYRPSLWLVDVKSGAQRPLAADGGANFSPRWSPDGKRIAYVSAGSDGAQIHVMWLDSGTSARVTGLPDGPGSIAWSPDGRQIAYSMRVPGEGATLGKAPDKPEGAEWAKPLTIIDKVTYRFDDAGYAKPGFDQVFVVSADGGASRRVTSGKWDAGGPLSWSPDSRAILFTGNRVEDWERAGRESEIYRVDLASGGITAVTHRVGPDFAPRLSPDGRKIAYLGFDDSAKAYEDTQLYVMDADGSNPRSLTASLNRSINDFAWSDSGTIYAVYADEGVTKVARIGLDGKRSVVAEGLQPGAISDRPYAAGEFSVSRNGTLAYTGTAIDRPGDLIVQAAGDKARQLTRLNATWLQGKDIAPMRKLAVKAPDGLAIDAWLIEPPHLRPGERVPMILEIHGGPNAEYGPGFSTDYQLYAAAGYAVLYTNPRGSTSYGADFANLIDKNYPGPDYDDLMAAVDAAIADGVADPDNLFVTGGSGGGVLTSWIVGKTDRFAAAATQKPVINWTSESLTADLATFAPRYWFGAMPWEQPMEYWRRSPLSLVGNVKTPTMVVVGEDDYRTPASESEQYYAALQLRGVPTTLVIVPEASHHGIAGRPSQSAAKASAIIAWFDRYRKGKTPAN